MICRDVLRSSYIRDVQRSSYIISTGLLSVLRWLHILLGHGFRSCVSAPASDLPNALAICGVTLYTDGCTGRTALPARRHPPLGQHSTQVCLGAPVLAGLQLLAAATHPHRVCLAALQPLAGATHPHRACLVPATGLARASDSVRLGLVGRALQQGPCLVALCPQVPVLSPAAALTRQQQAQA